jgi:hypothetical protein
MYASTPLVYLGLLLLGLAAERFLTIRSFGVDWLLLVAVGALLFIAGAAMMLAAGGLFRRLDTKVRPSQPTTVIATTGPYRWTRNPMYLGMGLSMRALRSALMGPIAVALLPLVNLLAIYCVLRWRMFWMTMINRTAPTASPDIALTKDEIDLMDRIVIQRTGQPPPRELSSYLIQIVRPGGYLARERDPSPGNTVIWRCWSRLMDMKLGVDLAGCTCG